MRTRGFLGFNYSAVCASHGPSFTRVIEGGWVGKEEEEEEGMELRSVIVCGPGWQWEESGIIIGTPTNPQSGDSDRAEIVGRVWLVARHISRHDSSQGLDFASIDRDEGLNLTGKLRFPPLSRLVCFSRALNVIISSTSTSTTNTLDGSRWKYAESCILSCLCNVYSRIVRRIAREQSTYSLPLSCVEQLRWNPMRTSLRNYSLSLSRFVF